ncbi:MAG: hypothetical protein M3R16_02275 [Pseudomonadota bacterium]|nr:hypothetical protein [Pseudomonadota bacterium]
MTAIRTEAERTRWIAFMQAQPLPLDVESKPYRKSRSSEQNNLLFGVLYPPIAEAMGYPVDGDNGIHAFMCGTFFGWEDRVVPKTPRNPDGISSFPIRSTTRTGWGQGKRDVVSAEIFGRFLETVERIAAQAGVFLPMERAA